jgi:hypothetical protein
MYDQTTGTVLTLVFLGVILLMSRPIWHWIKAGDTPRLLDPWVRIYKADHQADAILAARADIAATCPGYRIDTMSWEKGGPGIGRVAAIGIFAWAARPKGELTVTMAADVPVGSTPPTPFSQVPATTAKPGRSRWPIVGVLAVVGVLLVALGASGHSGLPSGSSGAKQVTYMVTGSASSINITYTDGSGNIEQQNGVSVPLTSKSGSAGITFTLNGGHFVSISAQNQGDSGTLDCAIEADGQVISTGHASGGYAIASCSTML